MPIAFSAHFWLARYGGFTFRDAMYDYDRTAEVMRCFLNATSVAHAVTCLWAITGNIDIPGARVIALPSYA